MHRFHYVLCVIVTAPLLLVVQPRTLASSTPVSRPELLPHPAEVALLEELSVWTGMAGPGLEADFTPTLSLEADLFRRQSSVEASQRLLEVLPFGSEIASVAAAEEVDPLLLASMVEVESRFDADAVSPRGARGLLQVMPETAADLGFDPCDPTGNLKAGASYLRALLQRYDGDLRRALAAYNAGPGAVARYGGIPPYRETLQYVDRVMRRYLDHLRDLWQAEGFELPRAVEEPQLVELLAAG